jgi:hypothetical protein
MQKMVAEADSSGVLTYDRNSERRASQWPRRPERGCRRLAEVHGARLRPIQIWRIVASATGCASFPVAFALAMPSHVLPKSETAGSGSVTEAVRQALTALFHWHAFCLSGCWKQFSVRKRVTDRSLVRPGQVFQRPLRAIRRSLDLLPELFPDGGPHLQVIPRIAELRS